MAEIKKKDEIFWKILNTAIELDTKKGHMKWSLSELSRKSGITRSLIYYYMGSSRQNILENAVQIIGEQMFGLSKKNLDLWKSGNFVESLVQTKRLILQHPEVFKFYFQHRQADTAIGESIRQQEEKLRRKVATHLTPHLPGFGDICTALIWGITLAPWLDEKDLIRAAEILKTQLK